VHSTRSKSNRLAKHQPTAARASPAGLATTASQCRALTHLLRVRQAGSAAASQCRALTHPLRVRQAGKGAAHCLEGLVRAMRAVLVRVQPQGELQRFRVRVRVSVRVSVWVRASPGATTGRAAEQERCEEGVSGVREERGGVGLEVGVGEGWGRGRLLGSCAATSRLHAAVCEALNQNKRNAEC